MVGVGLLAQWVWLIVQFAPSYRILHREAQSGWDERRAGRLFIAVALGDAGWALLFAAALLGAVATGSFIQFGLSTTLVLAASLALMLLPGAVVIMSIVALSRRARNVH